MDGDRCFIVVSKERYRRSVSSRIPGFDAKERLDKPSSHSTAIDKRPSDTSDELRNRGLGSESMFVCRDRGSLVFISETSKSGDEIVKSVAIP